VDYDLSRNLVGHYSSTSASGALDQWTANPSSYGLTANPDTSYLASFSTQKILQAEAGTSDALLRHAVSGDATANQMFTTLDMNGQALTNATTIDATGNITSAGQVKGATGLFTGAIQSSSLAATGAISAANVTATGAVNAANVTTTGAVNAGTGLQAPGVRVVVVSSD